MSHEGAQLKQVLERHSKKAADLAEAMGTKSQYVYQLFKKDKFQPTAWVKIAKGLRSLRIDPAAVGHGGDVEQPTAEGAPGGSSHEELEALVLDFTHEQLVSLEKLLLASREEREKLLTGIRFELRRWQRGQGKDERGGIVRYDDDEEGEDDSTQPPEPPRKRV